MLCEVQRRVADVEVLAADCRDLGEVQVRFGAAAFFFGLSYFDDADAAMVLAELHRVMHPNASLLLATVAGDPALTGVQVNTAGDRVFSFYRQKADIERLILEAGFGVVHAAAIKSPANASVQSKDIVVIGKRK